MKITNSFRSILFAAALVVQCDLNALPTTITLPPETAELKPSAHPGQVVAAQKCSICHSVDYINLQPRSMNLTQWTAEVTKMQHAYGAPIDTEEIAQISSYLASEYGTEKAIASTPLVAAPPANKDDTTQAKTLDGKALLSSNSCLGCHSISNKVLGPSYKDVAAKYRGDEQAAAKVQESIKLGGTGKWGAAKMPPYPKLTQDALQALAVFILKQ
jgi:cytochrome c551/c552